VHFSSKSCKSDVQEEFLSKPNSILTKNNVLDVPASNTDGFLSSDTCVSTTQLNRPLWNIESLSPPGKT
jgi:hypothetical protein